MRCAWGWRVQVVMSPRIVLPERVSLAALGEEWTVEYRETGGRFVAAGARPGRRLLVSGCTGDLELCRLALRRWLLRMGGEYLPPWLESLAVSRGFRFERAAVRLQRTRWGSYSRRGTVSLNARLLLLPPELTQYVMIHELCHSIHLDHSSRFWSLVRHHDPHCDRHRREIRAAGRQMPAWTR